MSQLPDKDGPDKDLPDEQQLDEYLRGGSAVSRQYRQLPSADVPADLDRRVLRQAQEAVKTRPAKSRTWMRWTGPLALAASAVLVLSIVIESGVHEEPYLTAPASMPADVMKQEAAELPAADNAADKRAAEPEHDEASGAANDASVVHVVPLESPSPVYDVLPAPMMSAEPARSEDRAFAIRPAAPQPAPPPQPAPAPQLEKAPPTEEVTVRAAKMQRQNELNSPSIAMPVTPLSSERDAELEEAVVTGMRRRQSTQTAGPRNTIAAPAAQEQADEPRDYSDPEQWLRDIRQLRKENKHDEANREWRRFRYVFPNYEVAEDDAARGALR